jgi:S1-C subfamily serine protease
VHSFFTGRVALVLAALAMAAAAAAEPARIPEGGRAEAARIPGAEAVRIPGADAPRVPVADAPRIPGADAARIPGADAARVPGEGGRAAEAARVPGAGGRPGDDARAPGEAGRATEAPRAAAEVERVEVPSPVESSVVRVLVYANPPDFFSPWQKEGTQAFAGSGVIIDGRRILTNAHVVSDAVGIEVKRAGSGEQFEAEVSYLGHDCDLALLTVADEHFFDGATPLALGELPAVNAGVQTYGFPVGGETLSVTSGVISRIEVGLYAHSNKRALIAQIDAPINPGNSGGPVIRDGAIAGISMQMLQEAESVGYMVPAPVVRHFLEDVSDGHYDGFPEIGVLLQPLESPALRESLGLAARQSGGLVSRVMHGSSAFGVLERGDVIVSIGGFPVSGDLTVAMPGVGRVSLDAIAGAKQVGSKLALQVLRAGSARDVEVQLSPGAALVPGRRTGDAPEFFLFGGAVFQPLTAEYFELYEDLPPRLAAYSDARAVITAERRQVVILSAVLPDPVARGYLDWESVVVRSVNGTVPRDLAHLAEIVDAATGKWLRVEIEEGFVMTLDIAAARAALPRILKKYGIPADRSANLLIR